MVHLMRSRELGRYVKEMSCREKGVEIFIEGLGGLRKKTLNKEKKRGIWSGYFGKRSRLRSVGDEDLTKYS